MKRLYYFLSGLPLILLLGGCSGAPTPQRVVLACAQDQEFADEILTDFHTRTGIEVAPKYDTEKDKSVSLYLELLKEKDRPRHDVFWNNEILLTLLLQRQGLLLPYESPKAKGYPDWTKPSDHTWHAFAARARVLVVNTALVPLEERPRSLLDLGAPRWKGNVVIARPLFGTSSTQAACLFEVLGKEHAKQYYRSLKLNQVHVAPGNKQVAEWVAQGRTPRGDPAHIGITDTDDALGEIARGRPLAMIFPDRDRPTEDRLGTLFIPNSVAILRRCPNPAGARMLVDFLLSTEIEERLATSESHQIPLNPEVKAVLPHGMETPATAKPMRVDWGRAADLWKEAIDFLREEFASAE